MTAVARTKGPVTLADTDPEMDQTIQDMEYIVRRFRDLGPMIIDARNDLSKYGKLQAAITDRADMLESIRLRGDRLGIKDPYVLMHIIEYAAPLTRRVNNGRVRRSPPTLAVIAALRHAQAYADKIAVERRVDFVVAKRAAQQASDDVTALGGAADYLEASLG